MMVLFWLLTLLALPSFVFLTVLSVIGCILTSVGMFAVVSGNGLNSLSGLFIILLGPMGIYALAKLNTVLMSVYRNGIAGIDESRQSVRNGVTVGIMPLIAVIIVTWDAVFSDHHSTSEFVFGLIMSGMPTVPLLILMIVCAFRRRQDRTGA